MSIKLRPQKYLEADTAFTKLSKNGLSFSKFLEAIRLGEGASLSEFAKKLGVSRSHLNLFLYLKFFFALLIDKH